MKKLFFVVLLAAFCAAGFVAGRMCAPCAVEASVPEGTPAGAEERIAELEKELETARNDANRARELALRAENAVDKALSGDESKKDKVKESTIVLNGTNTDLVAQMKKNMPEDTFVAVTNVMERMRAARAERAKGRREYIASLDVSGLSEKELENHKRFLELLERREKIMTSPKGPFADGNSLSELFGLSMQMRSVASKERKALLGALTRELGYTGDDGAVVTETMESIIDCTDPNMSSSFDGVAIEGHGGKSDGSGVMGGTLSIGGSFATP